MHSLHTACIIQQQLQYCTTHIIIFIYYVKSSWSSLCTSVQLSVHSYRQSTIDSTYQWNSILFLRANPRSKPIQVPGTIQDNKSDRRQTAHWTGNTYVTNHVPQIQHHQFIQPTI